MSQAIGTHTPTTHKHFKYVELRCWVGGWCAVVVVMAVAFPSFAGVQLLRSGRTISVAYRSVRLQGLVVQNLYEETEYRISAAIKSAGITQQLIHPLEAEVMLGICDVPLPWTGMAPLGDELVEQATHHTKPKTHNTCFVFCFGVVVVWWKGVGGDG